SRRRVVLVSARPRQTRSSSGRVAHQKTQGKVGRRRTDAQEAPSEKLRYSPRVQDRRGVLKALTTLLGGIVSAVVAIPGLRLLWHPVSHRMASNPEAPLRVASLAELTPGQPTRVTVTGTRSDAWLRLENQKLGACWLVRENDRVRAFSTV